MTAIEKKLILIVVLQKHKHNFSKNGIRIDKRRKNSFLTHQSDALFVKNKLFMNANFFQNKFGNILHLALLIALF